MTLVDGVGTWARVAPPNATRVGQPALFIDRDGVVTREAHFLGNAEEVTLLPRAAETIAIFNRIDIPVIVVTNQSGIARGHFSWRDFEEVEAEIGRQLYRSAGAHLDAVFACGYHKAGRGTLGVPDHAWRKPNPGMLFAAAIRVGVRLDLSWIVGDRALDIAAGRAAGLAGGIHVATGHGGTSRERRCALALRQAHFHVRTGTDLGDAVQLRELMVRQAKC